MRTRFLVFLSGLALIVGLLIGRLWVQDVTRYGTPHELWDVSFPGIDIGVDSFPATEQHAGYINIWWYPHEADDITNLLQIPGAHKRRPTLQPYPLTPGPTRGDV